jgi:hypothetical protein
MDMKAFHREVVTMQGRLKGFIDLPNDPKARALQDIFQKLEDEVQVGKSSGTIRDRLKAIEAQLKPAYEAGVISHGHFDELEDWTREYQQKIR